MRLTFFGSSKFGVPILKMLSDSKHDVFLCVTQPDKRKGRGLEIQPTPIKKAADYYRIKTIQPLDVNDDKVIEEINSFESDAFIVVSYGQILSKKLLEKTSYPLGVHPSLLPKYRGASPISHAILNGEELTGITIYKMDESMDGGDIIKAKELEIFPDENTLQLSQRLNNLAANFLIEVLNDIENNNFTFTPQDEERASYAYKLTKKDGFIDWNMPAIMIHNKIRAMFPWPGAYTYYIKNKEKKLLKIWESICFSSEGEFKPGEILDIKKQGILVGSYEGSVLIKSVQTEGKKKVSAYNFIQGARLSIGDNLFVP